MRAWLVLILACGSSHTFSSQDSGLGDAPADAAQPPFNAVQWVDVFVGTAPSAAPDPVTNGAGGSTFPAAALPFGMVQWGPDTSSGPPSGYAYGDPRITAFSLTHLSGAGCWAMRDFPVFPFSGTDPSTDPSDTFSHETASPGFYEVVLGSGITVDLAASKRGGMARFTFPSGPDATLVVANGHVTDLLSVKNPTLQVQADATIVGQRTNTFFCGGQPSYTVYFAARFDRAVKESGTYQLGGKSPGASDASGLGTGVYATFDTSREAVVTMKVGLSYVSAANAVANLDAEIPGWDFDAVHAAAVSQWNQALGHVVVEGGTDADLRAFYTALYHVLLQPAIASDVNGDYMGLDGTVKNDGHVRYQNFSLWDVYRSWAQLVAVLAPDEMGDIVRSLVIAGAECGALPKWPLANTNQGLMFGDPSSPFIANAYAFGARGFDAQAALALMIQDATDPSATCNGVSLRPGLADYLARHYIAQGDLQSPPGSVSVTLEYAQDDFAIGQLAHALGNEAVHATFADRATYWKNVFDPATGYLQPRMDDFFGMPVFGNVDVTSQDPGDLFGSSGFVEANSTQLTLAVQHDIPGLIAALGGDAVLVARLDALFAQVNAGLKQPYFYMGNEPGFSSPWAYAFAGAPYKTQAVVRRILREAFTGGPSGLPGNDDLGATSSWQAWAMLGMYPVIPGVGGVVLGSPTFPKATITLAGGAKLVIVADGAGSYVQSLRVNGNDSSSSWLDWSAMANGGNLSFVLGTTPNITWGSAPSDRP
jgi:predicted alpha-1,2-mannosidase